MSRHRPRIVLGALAVSSLIAAAGCKTTIDTAVTSAPSIPTTTTLPTGTPAELLPRLLAAAQKLSTAIGNNDNKSEQIALVNDLYNAARPAIEQADGVAVLNFDGAINLCQTAARLNRPADADKCFRNLTDLSNAFVRDNP